MLDGTPQGARLDSLGTADRPALKAGPFGSSVVKDSYVQEGFRVYGQTEVIDGFDNGKNYYVDTATYERHVACDARPGDILITMMGTVGRVRVLAEGAEVGIINPRLARISVDRSRVDPEYVCHHLEQTSVRRLLERRAQGGTMPGLTLSAIGSLRIPLPPLPEQRRIAGILRTWDEAIDAASRLIDAKRRRLDGVRARVLASWGSHPDWNTAPLSDLATRVRRKNDGAAHPVMTISAKQGFILQSDRYSRDMAGRSVENYTLLKRGEFSYNKGNSRTYPQGCVFPLGEDSALVPNVYISFRLRDESLSSYLAHVFAAGCLNRQLARFINSGVRNDGLLNLNIDDFFACRVTVPPPQVRAKQIEALDVAAQDLAASKAHLEALKRQKRGLMHKLLTGEWRVPAEPAV